MSVLREVRELQPYASHASVFLSDEEATSEVDYGAWHDEATKLRRVLVTPFELQVGTARYDVVPFTVRVWDSIPAPSTDAAHVIEADLQLPSGVAVIHSAVDEYATAPRITLQPGRYRVRVSYIARSTPLPESNPDEPGDHFDYVADFWASSSPQDPLTLVQGETVWAM